MPSTEVRVAPAGPWPRTTRRDDAGVLEVGGASLVDLATKYGTPLYVFDEASIREAAREFRDTFAAAYPRSRVVYAGKAFLSTTLVGILREEGIGLDVVSGGELYIGLRGGMPPEEISLHGNNKTPRELREALAAGCGKIVIDNEYEISLLEEMTADLTEPVTVMIRLNPGVDVHTHRKISTGVADSKFGFPIGDGQAEAAVVRLKAVPGLRLVGLHAHVGSQLFDSDANTAAIDELLAFASDMKNRQGFEMEHLSPGGGFGIAHTDDDAPLAVAAWAERLAAAVTAGCERHGLPLPTVTIEPGRAIAGPAAVAVYTVGATKALPEIRTYVSVDGGMADNIRPALYEARYAAALANRDDAASAQAVTIAGKFCESGDILIEDVVLPALSPGDLLAIPAAGAYTLSMASNYNAAPRPAVVLAGNGVARAIRRRETYHDLVRAEIDR